MYNLHFVITWYANAKYALKTDGLQVYLLQNIKLKLMKTKSKTEQVWVRTVHHVLEWVCDDVMYTVWDSALTVLSIRGGLVCNACLSLVCSDDDLNSDSIVPFLRSFSVCFKCSLALICSCSWTFFSGQLYTFLAAYIMQHIKKQSNKQQLKFLLLFLFDTSNLRHTAITPTSTSTRTLLSFCLYIVNNTPIRFA